MANESTGTVSFGHSGWFRAVRGVTEEQAMMVLTSSKQSHLMCMGIYILVCVELEQLPSPYWKRALAAR